MTAKSPKKTAVIFAENKAKLTEAAELLDITVDGAITSALKHTRFQGGAGEVTRVTLENEQVQQVLVVGVGKESGIEGKDFYTMGLKIGAQLDGLNVKEASICFGDMAGKVGSTQAATTLLEGIGMGTYRFDVFKSEQKSHQEPKLKSLTLLTSTRTAREVEENWPNTAALLLSAFHTRDYANLPPNIANPQFMADRAKELEKKGLKVEVIDEVQMEKLGLNLFLAVGGSAAKNDQPRLILIHYNGGKKGDAPIALVGKGIMFDTGGYNIKTGSYMAGMKYDMSGSSAVIGAMEAIAQRKPKINVVGVLACAMNMIGTTPFLPDSIYKSYKGLFVEIGNTDAEGRLVLADAVAYTIDKHNPYELVDLATLTGACLVALGGAYAGLFSTSDSLARRLSDAGDNVGERLWRMPIDDCYGAKSKVADVNNDGSPYGGASTGAVFIKKFADKTPWAHLDIAGTANQERGLPGIPAEFTGATGFGTRLLVNYVENEARSKSAHVAPSTKKRGRPRKSAA